MACGQQVHIHFLSDSTVLLEWQAEKVCSAFVIWMCASCGCRQKVLPNVCESARYLGPRTLPTQTPNLQTGVRTSSVVLIFGCYTDPDCMPRHGGCVASCCVSRPPRHYRNCDHRRIFFCLQEAAVALDDQCAWLDL